MESKVLKLMAQLGLLAVVIWAIAAASGRRAALSSGCGKGDGARRKARGVWAPSIVAAPMAQGAATMPVAIGPQTRY